MGPLRLHATVERAKTAVQMRVTASGNLDSTLTQWHAWLRGPETADIRATYEPSELTLGDSVVSNKALSIAAAGRLTAQQKGAPWVVAAKTRVTLADLSLCCRHCPVRPVSGRI